MKNISPALFAGAALLATPRAVFAAPRADVNDPKIMLANLATAVEAFKTKTNETLSARDAADVVVTTEMAKINDAISSLTKGIEDQAVTIAALRLNGAGTDDLPKDPEYLNAFKAHMRRGDAAGGTVNASLSVGTATDGGYMAPVEWDRTITQKLKQLSPIRANAQVITIGGNGFSRVYNDGVFSSGWVGETAARAGTTNPAWSTLSFITGEIYANPAITQIALDDIELDLEAWLSAEVDKEFSIQEGAAFLSGNGTNKPTGILLYVTGAANAATHPFGAILLTTAAAAAVVTADEILDLVYSIPSERQANAKFYMNKTTLGKLRKLKDGQGNFLWQPSYVAGQPEMLAGYPVVEIAGMPNMATGLVPILFGDMESTYLVIDRKGTRVLRDPFTNKPFINFYTTKRVGGAVQNPEYMRALKMA